MIVNLERLDMNAWSIYHTVNRIRPSEKTTLVHVIWEVQQKLKIAKYEAELFKVK